MSDSTIHGLSSIAVLSDTDVTAFDVYEPNDGLWYTYKTTYGTLKGLLSASVSTGFNSQITALQSSINTANSNINLKVAKAGDTMTGALILNSTLSASGAVDFFNTLNLNSHNITNVSTPVNSYDAVNKLYIDTLYNALTAATPNVSNLVSRTGDSMTGVLSVLSPVNAQHAVNLGYLNTTLTRFGSYLPLSGGAMTGDIDLNSVAFVKNVPFPVFSFDAVPKQYVDNGLSAKLGFDGGTLTGSLSLYGAPVARNEAVTKQYVDDSVSAAIVASGGAPCLALSGGTMVGGISAGGWRIVNVANPVLGTDAVNKTYLDTSYVIKTGSTMTGTLILAGAPSSDLDASTKKYVDDTVGTFTGNNGKLLPLSGGTMVGGISAGGWRIVNVPLPVLGTDAVNKTYTDTNLLPIAGGTMTGTLYLAADPVTNTQAATKKYVDDHSAGLGTYLPLSGGTMFGGGISAGGWRIVNVPLPVLATDVSNKAYVDTFLLKSGGTMTGTVYLPGGTLTLATEAVHKGYVDNLVSNNGTYLPLSGGSMTGGLSSVIPWRHVNVSTPVLANDAVNKSYIDSASGSFLQLAGGTLNGSIIIKGFSEKVVTNTNASGAVAINLALGNTFKLKLTGNVTGFTVTNIPVDGCSFTVFIENGTSVYTVAYPINGSATNPKWAAGTAPTMTATVNKIDVFSFTTYDGGTTWLGFNGGQNY